jgi:transglutaminase-like putative cysteine protease
VNLNHKTLSLLLLAFAALSPPSLLPVLGATFFCVLAVVYFWWAHGFKLQGLSLRFVALLLFLMFAAWRIGGGTGITGISTNFDFDPEKIRSLKRSDRVALRLVFDHEPTKDERYLRLGVQGSDESKSGNLRTAAWAMEHLSGLTLPEKTLRIQAWFRDSFQYSLDSKWLDLDSFLFDSKQGYCLHFSYSTKELLQMTGEKPQMVYGYSGGSWNPVFRTLTYRDSDAHSWLEVWNRELRTFERIDPTTWVLSVKTESNSSLVQGLPGILQFIVILLAIALALSLLLRLQDPRSLLQTLLKTRGPISTGLGKASESAMERGDPELSRRIDHLKKAYEDYYFSKKSALPGRMRVLSCIRLILMVLALYPNRKRMLS